jgi:enterochelin esterase family protein
MLTSKILTSSLVLLATGLCCADVDGQRRRRTSWRDRSSLKHILFVSDQKFDSEALANAKYSIFVPKSYDAKENAQKRYPVVYFLHGMLEDQNRFGSRGGSKVLDDAIAKKVLPEVIFVCAYDGNRRSFYVNSRNRLVETMIVRDLVPFIDKKYRTQADRAHRVLMGVSMGGFGAMKIAFKNPKVFGIVATHSAAIMPEKSEDLDEMFPWARRLRLATSIFGDPIDQKKWAAENPLLLAKSVDKEQLGSLKIYFDCGDKDRYGFNRTNAQMHDILTERKVKHTWTLVKGGTHGWNTRDSTIGYNTANLPNSLAFVGAALTQKKAVQGQKGLPSSGREEPTKAGKK